jgi:hypothetical protein
MGIVGFSFTKMGAEKTKSAQGKVNIQNNVSVTDVKEAKLAFGSSKQSGLEFAFKFTSTYEPALGKIELEGVVVDMEKEDKVKEVLAAWKKDKKVPKEILTGIYNNILNKCNIQALILSRDMQLPPPIPLPKVSTDMK